MLLRLGLKNHYSIRDRQDLSLVASSIDDPTNSLFRRSEIDEQILPSAIIYGANASGKSSLLSGLRRMRGAVLFSHPKWEPGQTGAKPYRLDPKTKGKPSVHEVDFIADSVRYNYGFEVTPKAFTSEWLYSFPKGRRQMLFERKGKEIDFGRSLKGKNKSIAFRVDSLFLSAAIQNGHEGLLPVGEFFRKMRWETMASKKDLDAYGTKGRVIEFLKKIRTGVVDFEKQEVELPNELQIVQKAMRSAILENGLSHKVKFQDEDKMVSVRLAHENKDGGQVFFDEDVESAGTQRLLYLLSIIFRTLDEGTLLLIDELDNSLHTQACEALIALFSTKATNPKGAQLIVTTHDTNLLQAECLRRDQFWFIEKENDGASRLYSLTDIRTRRGDNKEKGYLQGRYGATPIAGSLHDLVLGLKKR